MLKVMFVEEIENELKKVVESDYAFNIPDKGDFVMINGTMYFITDRMFDYDSGYVDCLVVKSDNLKKDHASDKNEDTQE